MSQALSTDNPAKSASKRRLSALSALAALIMTLAVVTLSSCSSSVELDIVVPAGSESEYAFCDQEISPRGDSLVVSSGEGLGDTEVIFVPVEYEWEAAYEPFYLTPGMPVELDLEPNAWYKVGVSVQNATDEDIRVAVAIEGSFDLRIE